MKTLWTVLKKIAKYWYLAVIAILGIFVAILFPKFSPKRERIKEIFDDHKEAVAKEKKAREEAKNKLVEATKVNYEDYVIRAEDLERRNIKRKEELNRMLKIIRDTRDQEELKKRLSQEFGIRVVSDDGESESPNEVK